MVIFKAKNITKIFSLEHGIFMQHEEILKALDNVSFQLNQFDTLGIVGESGSGKTTLAKIILKLMEPTAGEISFSEEIVKNFRKNVQIIFQNPYNSLNPKMRLFDTIAEPLIIHKIVQQKYLNDEILNLLAMVGLEKDTLRRYPHEFSGGQRQRICIARALASQPKLLVLDEPISSLDLTIQEKMLDLFLDLKKKLNLTYIFISHNLAVVKYIASSIIVMKSGAIIEEGAVDAIFSHPVNRYTYDLIEAAKENG